MEKLTVNDPLFNLVEIYEELLLLEKHLSKPVAHCKYCEMKHIYTISAYGKEMIHLAVGKYNQQIVINYMRLEARCDTLKVLLKTSNKDIEWKIKTLKAARDFRKKIEPIVYSYVT